jgi:hypothetical protein
MESTNTSTTTTGITRLQTTTTATTTTITLLHTFLQGLALSTMHTVANTHISRTLFIDA